MAKVGFERRSWKCNLLEVHGGTGKGVSSPVLFSSYVNDIPTPSCHIELAQYADDTALVATSKQLAFLVKYLETYLTDLEI